MGGKKPLRRPLWPPTRATASNYYPLGLDGAGGAAKPLLRAPKKPAPLHGRLPAFSGAVDAFERARKCFLEWRYFFSIILSEFLKNRVALQLEQIYEGKAKKVFKTDDPELLIVDYKDDATAFNGLKKGTILGKGVINNQMTNRLMAKMEKAGIPTHFVKELSQRETLVKRVSIVPLEVIVRNISAGSFAKRYGVEEGIVFDQPTIEFSYKNDALGDPLLNTYHALALKLATAEEIETIKNYAFAVNEVLKAFWAELSLIHI